MKKKSEKSHEGALVKITSFLKIQIPMKTFSTYLKKINLLLLLGGAVFVTGCNNTPQELGLKEDEKKSDNTATGLSYGLRSTQHESELQRLQKDVEIALKKILNQKETNRVRLQVLDDVIGVLENLLFGKTQGAWKEYIDKVNSTRPKLRGIDCKSRYRYIKAAKDFHTEFYKIEKEKYKDVISDMRKMEPSLSLNDLQQSLWKHKCELERLPASTTSMPKNLKQEIDACTGKIDERIKNLTEEIETLIKQVTDKNPEDLQKELDKELDKAKEEFFEVDKETRNKPRLPFFRRIFN